MNDYKIKTGIRFNIFILIIVENSLLYHGIHEFSVWLRTGSNLTDINRFRSHTGKICSSNEIQTFTKQGLKNPQIAKIYKSLIDKRTM